jgi:hypothetical protein
MIEATSEPVRYQTQLSSGAHPTFSDTMRDKGGSQTVDSGVSNTKTSSSSMTMANYKSCDELLPNKPLQPSPFKACCACS